MPKVVAHNHDKFDKLMRLFKRKVEQAGIVKAARDKEYYEKPTTKRRKARLSAIKAEKKRISDKK